MKVSDEDLEEYAERYVNEDKKNKTGLDFHEYLFAMVTLNRVVERIDVKWQKEQKKKLSIKYCYQRIMRWMRIS